ncbi:ABC transporter substrate-binding protein [uncultured Pseudokineococcus sp.]|uniref:ABC transporter substrate-binding protein n=1 Tax=uncultured Pseudokineococcus sp. TaxID=1642928 RepID=UPI0026399A56|nr:extracellular solute-binding protein [uncultured Pseudokineococcus sp.]
MNRSLRSTLVPGALALALVGATTACSSDVAGGGAAGGGGDGQTLAVAATTNEQAAMDAVIADFEEANPGVTVNATYSALDQYQTTTRTQLSSGTAPDVLFVWPGDGNPVAVDVVAPAGYLEDLSDEEWVADLPDGIRPVVQDTEGATWIAPISFSGIGAVYNMTALEEVGLTPPETWSELLQFCADAQEQGRSAFALGAQTNWVTQLIPFALTPSLVYRDNPDFAEQMAAGEASFADSEWTTAMDKNLEMQEAGCFQSDPLGTSYEATLTAVAQGDSLGVIQVNSAVPGVQGEAPEGTEVQLLPVPATDDPSETWMAGAAGSSYGINVDAANPDLAHQFLDYVMSPEGTNTYVTTNSALPAIPNDDFQVEPSLEALAQYQEEGRTYPFMDQQWPNARVQQTLFSVAQQLLGGQTDVPSALAAMDEAYAQG